jgi:hypothetical protein
VSVILKVKRYLPPKPAGIVIRLVLVEVSWKASVSKSSVLKVIAVSVKPVVLWSADAVRAQPIKEAPAGGSPLQSCCLRTIGRENCVISANS